MQEVCPRFEFARHFECHLALPPPFYMRMRTTRTKLRLHEPGADPRPSVPRPRARIGCGPSVYTVMYIYAPENKLQSVITAQRYLHAHFLATFALLKMPDLWDVKVLRTIFFHQFVLRGFLHIHLGRLLQYNVRRSILGTSKSSCVSNIC